MDKNKLKELLIEYKHISSLEEQYQIRILNEYKIVYEDIQTRSDLSYLKITQESFGDFVNNGSEVWTPSQRRLQEELEKNFNGDKEMTLDLVDELRIMLSYNHSVSDFISLFSFERSPTTGTPFFNALFTSYSCHLLQFSPSITNIIDDLSIWLFIAS